MGVAAGSKLRIVATFSIGSVTKAQNVYHVENVTGSEITDAEAVAVCLAYVEDIMDEFTQFCKSDVSLDKVEVYEFAALQWGPVGVAEGSWAGTDVTDRLPAGCAVLIHAFKERSGFSDKKYIAGCIDSVTVGDALTANMITGAEAAAAIWTAIFDDGTAQIEPHSYNQTTHAFTPYTGVYSVSPLIAYQRRRKPGVGLT